MFFDSVYTTDDRRFGWAAVAAAWSVLLALAAVLELWQAAL